MRISIIGLGVIGGSLGMALSARGHQITGIDNNPETLQIALETGVVASGTTDLAEGVQQAEVVFLAVPVASIIRIAGELKGCLPPETLVTDVGSTKGVLVPVLEQFFPSRFVGGHPMTGSELAGIRGADRYLFENALYVLTPTPATGELALEVVASLVRETGARFLQLSPDEHDLIVGVVSHLPHLLAMTLMNYASSLLVEHPEALLLAAGGFRDVTRIAAGHPDMWRDIYASNRGNLLTICSGFRALLQQMEQYLGQDDQQLLVAAIEEARQGRSRIPQLFRSLLPAVYEVVVTVPDTPGSIALIAGVLGERGINITDIEILRVCAGEGGSIRLSFKTDDEAQSAYQALREQGVVVLRR